MDLIYEHFFHITVSFMGCNQSSDAQNILIAFCVSND